MKLPKLSKKAIIISLSILGFLLFIGIFIALFPQLTYVASKVETVINDVVNNDTNTEEETNTEEDNNKEDTTSGGYSDVIAIKLDGKYDLTIEPKGYLKKITPPVSLFVKSNASKNIYDPDERVTCYEAGTISGTVIEEIDPLTGETKTIVIPDGTKYYAAVYQIYSDPDTGYDYEGIYRAAGWYSENGVLRYFSVDGKTYIFTDASLVDLATTNGIGKVVAHIPDSDPTDDITDDSYVYEKSVLESNVTVLTSDDDTEDFINASSYFALIKNDAETPYISYYYFITTKGATFETYGRYGASVTRTISDLSGYKVIDDYKGLKILQNSKKAFVIVDREGFAQNLKLQLPLETAVEKTFVWDDGTTMTATYSSSFGTCELSIDFTNDYVYEDLDPDSIKKIGTVDGFVVYEKKNISEDAFTKKLYNEDYLVGETWEYNGLTKDDDNALTYVEYLTYHPVIYMKDIYGDYVRYTNDNFFISGGCAKPAIYLYPTQTTDVSVKVVPNGKLTFTYPAYGNGWNVIADSNGNLKNKADGKTYNYLWWDSYTYNLNEPKEGFVVNKTDISTFLDDKLSQMNLNTNEINEFKKYWIPKIQIEDSEYVFVTFLFNDEVNQIAKLNVVPQPENTFRVFMLYKSVTESYSVNPLNILKADRNGYTLVEWGGAKL